MARLCGALSVASLGGAGHAQTTGAPAESTPRARAGPAAPPLCEPYDPTARRHDGFFARADSGLAGFFATVSGSATGRDRIRGIGQSAAIFIGGTPRPGLTVGGYVWASRIDPTFRVRGVHVSPDDDSVKLTLGRIGPFLDWYPDPLLGFHVQVNAGLAVQVESDEKGNSIKPAGIGAAGAFGV
ncbi:MAG TPA: hypothetical protein VHU80_21910, partial [Polyangiaceae bacterium]|nr:hypothetical protein [Polyangiaceae bacterium]